MEIPLKERKELCREHDISMNTVLVYEEILATFVPGMPVPKRPLTNISQETGLARSTVRRELAKLIQRGLIENRAGYFVPVKYEKPKYNTDIWPDYYLNSLGAIPEISVTHTNPELFYDQFLKTVSKLSFRAIDKDTVVGYTDPSTCLSTKAVLPLDKYNTKQVLVNSTSLELVIDHTQLNKEPDQELAASTSFNSLITTSVDQDIKDRFTKFASVKKRGRPKHVKEELATSTPMAQTEDTSLWHNVIPPENYSWSDLLLEPKSPHILERIVELGPEHWEVRAKYKIASDQFHQYVLGLQDIDPLETFDPSPYTSVNEMIGKERTALEFPPSILGNFSGKGRELVGRWKARKNRSLTFDQFLEYILMGDMPKPDEDSVAYHHWHDIFVMRKNAL